MPTYENVLDRFQIIHDSFTFVKGFYVVNKSQIIFAYANRIKIFPVNFHKMFQVLLDISLVRYVHAYKTKFHVAKNFAQIFSVISF